MTQSDFPKYDRYARSGIEWLEEIPSHWRVKRIKDISFLQSGVDIVSEQIEETGPFPVYGGNGVRGYSSEYTNDGHHVLIGRQGALCGNINYASGKFWASEHAVVAYLDDAINTKWFGETLRVMNLNQHSIAAAQPGLAVDRIKRLLLPVPPLPEQIAIADYLDTKTSQIDRKIDLLNQKEATYGILKQSLINETVTRGLDRSVLMKDSGVKWIGPIPAHWEVKRLKDIGASFIGLTYSPNEVVSGDEIGSLLVLRSSNIQQNDLSLVDTVYVKKKVAPKLILKKGDILICSRNGSRNLIGKNICIDERTEGQTFGAFMAVYRTKYFRFMSKFFNSNVFEAQSGLFMSSTVNQLTQNTLNNFLIPFPPLDEQRVIAEYLDAETADIQTIIVLLRTEIEKLQELRKALLHDVVTGKIKVVAA